MAKKKPADAFQLSIRHHPNTTLPLSLVYLHKIDGPARHCVMDGEVWPDMAAKLEEWAKQLGIPVVVESSPWESETFAAAPGEGDMGEAKTGDLFAGIPADGDKA